MKLPQRDHGFTLIELLVVIAIIAILATVGLVIYANVQKNARDARRRGDITAISKALEAHYNATQNANCTGNGGTYCPLAGGWFSSNNGSVPTDPQGGGITVYCMWSSPTGQTISAPAAWTSACPSVNVGSTSTAGTAIAAGGGMPLLGTTNWLLCASLETVTGGTFCVGNQQQ